MGVPDMRQLSSITDNMTCAPGVTLHEQKHKLKQRFIVTKKLGQGTYGKVQLAIDKNTGQSVAIKTIKKQKIETQKDLIRIRREIQIMSCIRHPHIIRVYEVFENRDKIVIVLEYAAGGELFEYLSEHGCLPHNDARKIFRQIATACYYCHKFNICHRDLKLENILLDVNGNAKIADFGLSNVFDTSATHRLGTFCGSPLYASPEIVRGRPYVGPEVDCWSLGVLLYTLVFGVMPFSGVTFAALVQQISCGRFHQPPHHSAAIELIEWMLTVDCRRRATIGDICDHWWLNAGCAVDCRHAAETLVARQPVHRAALTALVASGVQDVADGATIAATPPTPAAIRESRPTPLQPPAEQWLAGPAERVSLSRTDSLRGCRLSQAANRPEVGHEWLREELMASTVAQSNNVHKRPTQTFQIPVCSVQDHTADGNAPSVYASHGRQPQAVHLQEEAALSRRSTMHVSHQLSSYDYASQEQRTQERQDLQECVVRPHSSCEQAHARSARAVGASEFQRRFSLDDGVRRRSCVQREVCGSGTAFYQGTINGYLHGGCDAARSGAPNKPRSAVEASCDVEMGAESPSSACSYPEQQTSTHKMATLIMNQQLFKISRQLEDGGRHTPSHARDDRVTGVMGVGMLGRCAKIDEEPDLLADDDHQRQSPRQSCRRLDAGRTHKHAGQACLQELSRRLSRSYDANNGSEQTQVARSQSYPYARKSSVTSSLFLYRHKKPRRRSDTNCDAAGDQRIVSADVECYTTHDASEHSHTRSAVEMADERMSASTWSKTRRNSHTYKMAAQWETLLKAEPSRPTTLERPRRKLRDSLSIQSKVPVVSDAMKQQSSGVGNVWVSEARKIFERSAAEVNGSSTLPTSFRKKSVILQDAGGLIPIKDDAGRIHLYSHCGSLNDTVGVWASGGGRNSTGDSCRDTTCNHPSAKTTGIRTTNTRKCQSKLAAHNATNSTEPADTCGVQNTARSKKKTRKSIKLHSATASTSDKAAKSNTDRNLSNVPEGLIHTLDNPQDSVQLATSLWSSQEPMSNNYQVSTSLDGVHCSPTASSNTGLLLGTRSESGQTLRKSPRKLHVPNRLTKTETLTTVDNCDTRADAVVNDDDRTASLNQEISTPYTAQQNGGDFPMKTQEERATSVNEEIKVTVSVDQQETKQSVTNEKDKMSVAGNDCTPPIGMTDSLKSSLEAHTHTKKPEENGEEPVYEKSGRRASYARDFISRFLDRSNKSSKSPASSTPILTYFSRTKSGDLPIMDSSSTMHGGCDADSLKNTAESVFGACFSNSSNASLVDHIELEFRNEQQRSPFSTDIAKCQEHKSCNDKDLHQKETQSILEKIASLNNTSANDAKLPELEEKLRHNKTNEFNAVRIRSKDSHGRTKYIKRPQAEHTDLATPPASQANENLRSTKEQESEDAGDIDLIVAAQDLAEDVSETSSMDTASLRAGAGGGVAPARRHSDEVNDRIVRKSYMPRFNTARRARDPCISRSLLYLYDEPTPPPQAAGDDTNHRADQARITRLYGAGSTIGSLQRRARSVTTDLAGARAGASAARASIAVGQPVSDLVRRRGSGGSRESLSSLYADDTGGCGAGVAYSRRHTTYLPSTTSSGAGDLGSSGTAGQSRTFRLSKISENVLRNLEMAASAIQSARRRRQQPSTEHEF